MVWALAILLTAVPDGDLSAAEQSWAAGKYDLVLPRLDKALSHPLPAEELVRAYALQAHVHIAFDRLDEATTSFRRLLGVDEHWLLEPDASPKLLAVFAEARRKGAIAPAAAALVPKPKPIAPVVVAPVVPVAPAPEEPKSSPKWWIGVVVGVVVVGAVAGTVYWFERPVVPDGSLGRGELR